jgi:hypothetical protein
MSATSAEEKTFFCLSCRKRKHLEDRRIVSGSHGIKQIMCQECVDARKNRVSKERKKKRNVFTEKQMNGFLKYIDSHGG